MRKILSKLTAKLGLGVVLAAAVPAIAAHAIDYSSNGTTQVSGAAAAGIGIGLLVFFLIFAVVALFFLIFWIKMLIDALHRNWKNDSDKTMWLAILIVGFVVGLYWLAALVYYFAVKKAGGTQGASRPAAARRR